MARLTAMVAVVALVGCGHVSKRQEGNSSVGGAAASGGTSGASANGGSNGGSDVITEPPACLVSLLSPPEVPLRALGESELRNELALFGQSLDGETFPEPHSPIYDLEPAPDASFQFVSGHADFVHDLARRVTADAVGLGKLLGCDVAAAPGKCQTKLFDFVIARLFRGQQTMETAAELQQVFDAGQQLGGDFPSGARAVLEVALQSPEFLYRVERGRPVEYRGADWSQPTDIEMASRLSFLLWDRGPDDELLAVAAQGGLTDPLDIAAQARRLLADERGRDGVRHFYRDLLRISRLPYLDGQQTPELTQDVVALMDQEFAGFVDHATFTAPGDFQALFEPRTWLNGRLASYYGLPGVTGDEFRAVDLDPIRYAGILTQPAWLLRASSPTFSNPSRRGWVVAGAFLCQVVPPEPPIAPIPTDPVGPLGRTTRERVAQHAADPTCAGCHRIMDPLGFALEHFDPAGRYRETEQGFAIDTTGHWAPDGPPFDGAAELGALLAESPEARACFVSQWARYAFGRAEEEHNACTRSDLLEQFASDDNVLELLVALTQTESFRFRKAQP